MKYSFLLLIISIFLCIWKIQCLEDTVKIKVKLESGAIMPNRTDPYSDEFYIYSNKNLDVSHFGDTILNTGVRFEILDKNYFFEFTYDVASENQHEGGLHFRLKNPAKFIDSNFHDEICFNVYKRPFYSASVRKGLPIGKLTLRKIHSVEFIQEQIKKDEL